MNVLHGRRNLLFLLAPGVVFLLFFFLSPLAYVLVESIQAEEE
jgi:ABC-type uncharacterized transport system permease subunit